jgi:predicted nucleotidyltransferase
MPSDSIKDLADLLLERHPGLSAAYLFGSRATGFARTDSDWDIALLGSGLDPAQLRLTAAQAASLLSAETDLIDLRHASTVLKAELLKHGRPILVADPGKVARFEMEVLTEYQNLNENRKCILADFGMAA